MLSMLRVLWLLIRRASAAAQRVWQGPEAVKQDAIWPEEPWVLPRGRGCTMVADARGRSSMKIFWNFGGNVNENSEKLKQMYLENEKLIASTNDTATFMGVTPKTIHEWTRQGCPKYKRGWFDVGEVVRWRMSSTGAATGGDKAKVDADVRYKTARAAIAEKELALKNGELLPTILVENRLTELFSNLKTSILAIPDHIMAEIYSQYPELAPQVRRLIDGYIREALKQIANNGGILEEAGQPVKKPVGRPRKNNK